MTPSQLQAYLGWINGTTPPGTLGDSFLGGPGILFSSIAITPQMFGAKGDGTTDDTANFQAAIDAAYTAGLPVWVMPGTYAVTGLTFYNKMTAYFTQGSVISYKGSGTPCISGVASPGATKGNGNGFTRLYLHKPTINMNSNSGTGIFFDNAAWCTVESPEIYATNSGTWTYSTTLGNTTVPDGAFVYHSTDGPAPAYYNRLITPDFHNTSGTVGGVGVWYGLPDSQTDGRPNVCHVLGGTVRYFATGVLARTGGDCIISHTDLSKNTIGIQLGDALQLNPTRFLLEQLYLENCTTGINMTATASRNYVVRIASVSGTTTPIVDPGGTFDNNFYIGMNAESSSFAQTHGTNQFYDTGSGGNQGGIEIISFGSSATLSLSQHNGTVGTPTPTLAGNIIGEIDAFGSEDSTITTTESARISFIAPVDWGGSNGSPSNIMLEPRPAGAGREVEVLVTPTGSAFAHGIGLFGNTPPASVFTPAGNTTVGSGGSGSAVKVDTTFSGANGSNSYTIGDIVTALKLYGLLG